MTSNVLKNTLLPSSTKSQNTIFAPEKLSSYLKKLSDQDLAVRFAKLVRTERKITHLVLVYIAEFESRRLYAEYGFDSMFNYLTKFLGYSESAAYRRLQSARLLKQVPTAAAKVEEGKLNLSQLTEVQKCIKHQAHNGNTISMEKAEQILEKLENCNTFETKEILNQEFNFPIQEQTVITPQKDESVRLEITLTKEQFDELKMAQSLLSHVCFDGDLSAVITTLATKFNKSKLNSQKSQPALTQSFAATQVKRGYISIHTKRTLFNFANHSCSYINSDGRRSNSRYQLQIDHRVPLALGGTSHPNNLRILCRTHNLLAARTAGLRSQSYQRNTARP